MKESDITTHRSWGQYGTSLNESVEKIIRYESVNYRRKRKRKSNGSNKAGRYQNKGT